MLIGTVESSFFVYSTHVNSKTCVLRVLAPPFDPEFSCWSNYELYSEKDLTELVGKLIEFETEVRVPGTLGGRHEFECVNKFKPC